MSSQGEEIFLDMFEDEYRSMTVSRPSFDKTFVLWVFVCVGAVRGLVCTHARVYVAE